MELMERERIKFEIRALKEEAPKDPRIRELRYWCKKFHRCGFTLPSKSGSYGNFSFILSRGENQFIITASGVSSKGRLPNQCFVKVFSCDLRRGIVYISSKRAPSSESRLHFIIYRKRKDVNAIFHGHSSLILKQASKLGQAFCLYLPFLSSAYKSLEKR